MSNEIQELWEKRQKLVDDVQYYSGNEKAGYAAIADIDRQIAELMIKDLKLLRLDRGE